MEAAKKSRWKVPLIWAGSLTALGLGGYFAYKYRGPISKVFSNIKEGLNLSAEVAFKRIHALRPGLVLELVLGINLLNLTGFDLEAADVFVKLQTKRGNEWTDIGRIPKRIESVKTKDGEDTRFDINLQVKLLPLIAALSDKTAKFRTLTYYKVNQTVMPVLAEEIELDRYLDLSALKKLVMGQPSQATKGLSALAPVQKSSQLLSALLV